MHRDLMTLREFGEECGLPYRRAAELARTGIIPVVRLGRQVRVSRQQIAAFFARGGQALPGGWRREAS